MRHIRVMSLERPANAQFESVLQLIGVVNGALSTMRTVISVVADVIQLFQSVLEVFFGVDSVQKQ